MPTVIALDVSLSMTRAVPGNSQQTYHSLAVIGINCFLNYLQENSKLEQVSLRGSFKEESALISIISRIKTTQVRAMTNENSVCILNFIQWIKILKLYKIIFLTVFLSLKLLQFSWMLLLPMTIHVGLRIESPLTKLTFKH
uniref:CSON011847 protein n=1 Tax=Culicoides sonorensis TaxID=179676 RepID=A0A336M856_CULSO